MFETLYINQRVRQRGITKKMIDLTLEYGKLMDKGDLVVVFSGATLITTYAWR